MIFITAEQKISIVNHKFAFLAKTHIFTFKIINDDNLNFWEEKIAKNNFPQKCIFAVGKKSLAAW